MWISRYSRLIESIYQTIHCQFKIKFSLPIEMKFEPLGNCASNEAEKYLNDHHSNLHLISFKYISRYINGNLFRYYLSTFSQLSIALHASTQIHYSYIAFPMSIVTSIHDSNIILLFWMNKSIIGLVWFQQSAIFHNSIRGRWL